MLPRPCSADFPRLTAERTISALSRILQATRGAVTSISDASTTHDISAIFAPLYLTITEPGRFESLTPEIKARACGVHVSPQNYYITTLRLPDCAVTMSLAELGVLLSPHLRCLQAS